jgi:hypothetical protein
MHADISSRTVRYPQNFSEGKKKAGEELPKESLT